MSETFLFSSESVNEGHPDKICDQVSDAVLDACIREDPLSRVACGKLSFKQLFACKISLLDDVIISILYYTMQKHAQRLAW